MNSERIMALRAQQKRENERHRSAMAQMVADRTLALADENAVKRNAKLSKVTARQNDERSRHRDKVADLERKLRDAWS